MDVSQSINWQAFMPMGVNALRALGIFLVGWMLARWVDRLIRKRLGNDKGLQVDDTVRPLLAITVRYAIIMAALYAALRTANIPAESLLAVFGAAGLAIALAVQGTLSNVAAGIMLIFLRAIKVGEYIETPRLSGTVLEIGLFTTGIKDANGVFISVPNAQIWGSEIKNYSRFKTRRIDVDIDIARDNDLAAALDCLRLATASFKGVTAPETAQISVYGFSGQSAKLRVRCWLGTQDLSQQGSALHVHLHDAIKEGGFKLPPFSLAK